MAELSRLSPSDLEPIKAELKRIRGFSARGFDKVIGEYRHADESEPGRRGTHAVKPLYFDNAGGIAFIDVAAGGDGSPVAVEICNFTARIDHEVIRDDGVEAARRFAIRGKLADGRDARAEVDADKYESMSWVAAQFGPTAVIHAGRGVKDHARAAIQILSGKVPSRVVHTHTGWRKIGDGWAYLHAGGAIGPGGVDPSVSVDLSEHGLARYILPPPPEGDELRQAVRSHLGVLRLGQSGRPRSRAVASLILATPCRAALGPVRYTVQFNGPTGSHKSCAAALALQAFGKGMGFGDLPMAWNSTANAIQAARHALKDSLLVLDDWVPSGSRQEREKANQMAEDVFRTQGNGQGRRRMGPDQKMRAPMDPRGSLLSTGEDRPTRASANLRTIGVWFDKEDAGRPRPGTIDRAVLTECQDDADAGAYAASMSGFLRWVAARYEPVRDRLASEATRYRPLATRAGDHGRTPDIVADLAAGLDVFLEFATDAGAVTPEEAARHRRAAWDGLMEAADEMREEHHDGPDDAARFIQLIGSALSSNQVYLVDDATGGEPREIEAACGWRQVLKWQGADVGQVPMWEVGPNAKKIGWTDGTLVYLDPDASYNAALQMVRDRDEALPSQRNLHRGLFGAGKLARVDSRNGAEGKGRLTCRETIERQRRYVLVLHAADFWGDGRDEPSRGDGASPTREVSL